MKLALCYGVGVGALLAIAYRRELGAVRARLAASRPESIRYYRGRLWDDVREAITNAG